MQCPKCSSTHICKNGTREGKQRYICIDCQRQFLSYMNRPKVIRTISNESVLSCISTVGFRAIERVKHVHHTTIIYWVKQLGGRLPDTPAEAKSQVGELDELQTFVRSKKNKIWLWSAVNHFAQVSPGSWATALKPSVYCGELLVAGIATFTSQMGTKFIKFH